MIVATASTLESLPILHAGHPIWYRGRVAAVTVDGEVYSIGWAEPADRTVLRALALAASEAPYFTANQQLGFAAYYLLPDERWGNLRLLPDEAIERATGLPIDLIACRRALPPLDSSDLELAAALAVA